MNNRKFAVVLIAVLALFVMAACTPAEEAPVEEAPVEEEAAEEEAVEEEAAEEEAVETTTGRGGACLGTAEEALVDLDCREITIAIENAYLPFNYIELETGNAGGWDYDVIEEVCVRLHCTPVFVEAGWETMIQAVSQGQYDMAGDGITITEDRAEVVDFSIGYINIEQRLLVRADEENITGIETFQENPDLVLGTQTGTTNYETAIELLPEEQISAFEQFPFAVQALLAGDVDAVIIDEVAGQGYIGENADALKLVGESLSSDQLGFIYPLGSDLVEPVNTALQSMMADGTLSEINAVYFGPDFAVTYDDIQEIEYDE